MIEDRITQLFYENFIKTKDDRSIVIYGTGAWTRMILDRYPGSSVYGLLDGYFREGEIKGVPIITLEALAGKTVKIVIIARKAAEILIYKRIKDTCQNYHIPIYNLEGMWLNAPNNEPSLAEERDIASLYRELAPFDWISFDIFDTLLIRKTVFRESLYQAMGRIQKLDFEFCQVRLQSEREMLKKGIEPTLDGIYEQVRQIVGIPHSLAEKLKKLEVQLEQDNLVPRREIKALYDQLVAEGKRIWLISDMYFSKALLEQILERNEIRGFEEILISCEYGVNKQNGLFEEYLRQTPVSRKAHVGDSREADGYCAEKNGLVPFVIPTIMETAAQKAARDLLLNYENETLEYIRGLSFTRMFDSPQILSSRIWFHTGYQLGFCVVAPVLYGWSHWIYEQCLHQQIKKILFVSRDGFLLRKVFQKICGYKKSEIETEYLIFSRSLGWRASIYTEDDLQELLTRPFAGTISEWLENRFGIVTEDARNFAGNEEEILFYKDAILIESEKIRRRYLNYWDEKIVEKNKMAIVDFVSSGTCQKRLEKLTGCQLQGLYFEVLSPSYEMLHAQSYIHSFWKQDVPVYNYLLWELLLKEPTASVKSMDDDGFFVYGKNRLDRKKIDFIQEVHTGVLDFTDQYLSELARMQTEENTDPFVQAEILLPNEKYMVLGSAIKECLRGFDEFTNREIVY